MRRSPLSVSLSPNVEPADVRFAFAARFFPWRWRSWRKGAAIERLHTRFEEMFDATAAFSFDNGRSALQLVIEALELPQDSSVVVQAFSCIVVPNSVKAAGSTPVFADIDKTYNIDPESLSALLEADPSIAAVVVQHTFGSPADMDAIVALCTRHNVALIEDCAHALGTRYRGKLVGTFGVAAIFSFGRDKVLSTVSGGVAIVHTQPLAQRLQSRWVQLEFPSRRWIAQRLNHPLVFWLSLNMYYVASVGKVLVALAKRIGLFPLVLEPSEQCGTALPPRGFPHVLAQWALLQLDRLDWFNRHRHHIAQFYGAALDGLVQLPALHTTSEDAQFFRYTIEVDDPQKLLKMAKNRGILLGDWYHQVLAPAGADASSVGYVDGSCPAAERAITRVVNLPTHVGVNQNDAQRVVDLIRDYSSS